MKKNLITVLKKLLTAFGGDDKSVKNNAVDIIDKIADNASSGGSRGDALVVNMTKDGDESYVADKTMKEIFDAAKTSVIIVHWPDVGDRTNRYEPVRVEKYGPDASIIYYSGYIYGLYSDDNTSWNIQA